MADDPRLDPRQRPLLKMMEGRGSSSAMVISKESEKDNTWEEIYARANTPARQKQMQATFKMMEGLGDTNSVPVSTLDVQEGTFISNPDNNHVPFVFFRPNTYIALYFYALRYSLTPALRFPFSVDNSLLHLL